MTAGHASALDTVSVDDLVLDPALQCREAVLEEVVADYAQALEDGVELPPIRVVRVDGRLCVVDGWHRLRAYQSIGRHIVPVQITDGTAFEALLAAVSANATHGLQRTMADKRRAVRALLQHPEAACWSNRRIAAAAGVSHTFVAETRQRYGIRPGEVLTEARMEVVDGELPAAWRACLRHRDPYWNTKLRAYRRAASPRELARLDLGSFWVDAIHLRLDELAVTPWPWPDDRDEAARLERCAVVDSADDLERALLSIDCPRAERIGLLEDLRCAVALNGSNAKACAERWARRPRLRALALEKAREHAEHRAANPWVATQAFFEYARQGNIAEASAAFGRLSAEARTVALPHYSLADLSPALRDGIVREALESGQRCVACGGWIRRDNDRCAQCDVDRRTTQRRIAGQIRTAARLLAHPGVVMVVEGEVPVDRAALGVLRAIWDSLTRTDGMTWREDPAVAEAIATWAGVGDEPAIVGRWDAGEDN